MLLEAKGQPLIALAKSLFVFSAFVQGCKDSKEEELEELPQVKGRVAAEAGERKLLAWEVGGGGGGVARGWFREHGDLRRNSGRVFCIILAPAQSL